MSRKENQLGGYKYPNKIISTTNLRKVLDTLNQNTGWRNKSSKLQMSKPIPKTMGGTNQMTEDDIEKMFSNSNEKKYSQMMKESVKIGWEYSKVKDFAAAIPFLVIQDFQDKLLSGFQPYPMLTSKKYSDMLVSQNKKEDLTSLFKQDYVVGKVIGEGAYASVRIAIYKPLNKKIAIKVYEKEKLKEAQKKKSVRRQIMILQHLEHENIVQLHDVVETNNHLNLIMEYLPGVSLGTYIKNQQKQRINQKQCRRIIKSLADALKYLHAKKIAHRDIKLENIILDSDLNPKLIDFGFSTCIEKNKKIKIFCGTPSYMAPEIVQKKQYRGENADVWALGVLFFVIFVGIFPFKGATDQELYNKINKADYPKSELLFGQVSDLIERMLTIDPQKRISASEILLHPWVQNNIRQKKSPTDIKKRNMTISSNKSKQEKKSKKNLTETWKENLKLQLRFSKGEWMQWKNNTSSNRKGGCKIIKTEENKEQFVSKIKRNKKGQKIINMLRMEIKRKEGQKQRGRERRI